jgi:phospholipid/cholesterol/gamma-HCH transport system ATP-binding protein
MTESDPKPEQESESESKAQPSAEGRASEVAHGESAEAAAGSQKSAEAAAEAQESVHEFMAEAAEQNEAANEAVSAGGEETGTGVGIGIGTSADDSGPAPFIAFEHVYKSFGDLVVLNDVSFSVLPGDTLCILGRSGVGKSVALQILMGFLRADAGRVMVAGEDLCGFTEKQLQAIRRKVTMVFQNGALFDSITVGENVAFPLRERHDLAEDQIQKIVTGMLDMVGVANMENVLPSDLSTGMKRSVAIARALASQPEAVLYDEPTTMVDPLMGHLLGSLIALLKTQLHLTSIVVTHDMRLARKLADSVVFLHQGEVRFFGTVEEMDRSDDPDLQEFLSLDALVLPA